MKQVIRLGAVFLCLGTGVAQPTPSPSPDWGEQQLLLVLHDRPQLQSLVQKGNAIWNWLQAAFADTSDGTHVVWDNTQTNANNQDFAGAQSSCYPDDKNIAHVLVDGTYKAGPAKGAPLSSEEILSKLVYELYNVRQWPDRKKVMQLAASKKISKEEFIREGTQTEYLAAKKTADFYRTIWLPFCRQNKLRDTSLFWYTPLPATFDLWLSRYPPAYWYPWKCYGNMYDAIIAYQTGSSKLRDGDYDQASTAFNEFVRLNPQEVFGYNMLAWLMATCPEPHFRNGKKAIENATTACELTEWKSSAELDTLAAAYAETGDFVNAEKYQNLAISYQGDQLASDGQKKRLSLYQSHQPYRLEKCHVN